MNIIIMIEFEFIFGSIRFGSDSEFRSPKWSEFRIMIGVGQGH